MQLQPSDDHRNPAWRPSGNTVLIALKTTIPALVILLVFIIYSSAITAPFQFDDGHNIVDNSHIRLARLNLEGLQQAALESPLPNRPIAYISFALNYYFHKYHPAGYRLVNILIHLLAGLFLFLLLTTTMGLPSLRNRYGNHTWIAFTAVLIWLVHPLHTQSVTYIVQRMNSMAAMFYLLCLLCYVRARMARKGFRKWLPAGSCLVAGVLALGTKESAATLPVFIFLYEWFFFQDLDRRWLKRHIVWLPAVMLLFIGLGVMYLGGHPLAGIMSGFSHRDFTPLQRVLTESRVVLLYLGLLFYPNPQRLNLDYDFALSRSLIDPLTTLLSTGVIISLLVLAVWTARKDRLLSFCLLWFLGNLVIESSLIGLELVFEHRTYLPSMLPVLAVVVLADRWIGSKMLKIVGAVCVVLIFCAWTYERNIVWSSNVTLWADTVTKSPHKARPVNNLGNALKRRGKLEQAIFQFHRALQINPNYAKAHNNLGTALAAQGKTGQALEQFAIALQLSPHYAAAHSNMGVALAGQERFDEAIAHFSEALRLKPNYAKIHNNLGAALVHRGRLKQALGHFFSALRIKPDDRDAYKNLKICLRLMQKKAAGSQTPTASKQPLPTQKIP